MPCWFSAAALSLQATTAVVTVLPQTPGFADPVVAVAATAPAPPSARVPAATPAATLLVIAAVRLAVMDNIVVPPERKAA